MAVGVGVVALALTALYGGNVFGIRDRFVGAAPDPLAPVAGATASGTTPDDAATDVTRVRSSPWWQTVDTVSGDGDGPASFQIASNAIQWRITPTCAAGALQVEEPGADEPVAAGDCSSDPDPGFGTSSGEVGLDVQAAGSWQLKVEQQIDVPLEEPPLSAMSDATAIRSGIFYDVDQTGRGTATLHQLPNGRYALRLDEFFVSPNIDLEVRLSPLDKPKSTEEYDNGESALIRVLGPTAGSLNIEIPEDIDPTEYGSVVIWCPPILSVYAAASLEPTS